MYRWRERKPGPSPHRWVRRLPAVAGAVAREHWLLLLLLVAGVALRVVTQLAYRPALLYIDSLRYLTQLPSLNPVGIDPIGYDVFLVKPVLAVGGFAAVVAVQHLLIVAAAVGIYALLLRRGAYRWVAALATAPVLLDAYQLQIEQNLMSDSLLEVILVALLLVLGWRRDPGPWAAGAAGLLCVAALLVRLVAIGLIVPVVLYLGIVAWRRFRESGDPRRLVRPVGAVVLAFAAGTFSYAAYFHAWSGHWGITASGGSAMYGRAASVADCPALHLSPQARRLCPALPPGHRHGPDWYAHARASPALQLRVHHVPLPEIGASIAEFNHAVVFQQPLAVAEASLKDFAKGFRWAKTDAPGDVPVARWQFQRRYPVFSLDTAHLDPALAHVDSLTALRRAGYPGPQVSEPLAGFLRWYQLHGGYTPGAVLGALFLLGIAGLAARRGRRPELRLPALLPCGMAAVLLGIAALTEFSWRYQLPALVLAPTAAALGLTAWRRRPAAARGAPAAEADSAAGTVPGEGVPAARKYPQDGQAPA